MDSVMVGTVVSEAWVVVSEGWAVGAGWEEEETAVSEAAGGQAGGWEGG